MKNYRKHIDDFFREKLGRYRETPPADVWDDLEGKLDTLKPYVPKPPMRWVWHLSMVSLIAVLGVSLTRKFMSTPKESQPVAKRTVTTTQSPTLTAQVATGANAVQSAANDAAAPDQGNVAAGGESANGVSGANNGVTSEGNAENNTMAASPVSSSVPNNAGANNTSSYAHVRSSKRHTGSAKYSTQDILDAIEANKAAAAANNAARGVSATSGGSSVLAAAAHNNGKANRANISGASKTTQYFSAKTNNTAATSLVRSTEQSTVPAVEPEPTTAGSAQQQVNASAQTSANSDATKDVAAKAKAKQKELAAADVKKQAEKEKAKQNDKPRVKRFDFGVKGGYELGLGSQLANKWAIAPYVQYHLSSKFALMTQPGVKYATIAAHSVGSAASYYSVNPDGQVVQGPTTIGVRVIGANVDTFYSTKYTYRQSHDSIVKSKTYGGSYMEYEIPLLVQYSLNKELSVYGGVNLVYSQRTMANEHTGNYSNIVRSVDTTITSIGAPGTPPALNDVITYTGNSFAEYHNSAYPMKVDNIFRLGYMVGMSYQYSQRWLFDAMLQQTPMKPDVRDGFNVNRTLSAPYLRLSVGYKISK